MAYKIAAGDLGIGEEAWALDAKVKSRWMFGRFEAELNQYRVFRRAEIDIRAAQERQAELEAARRRFVGEAPSAAADAVGRTLSGQAQVFVQGLDLLNELRVSGRITRPEHVVFADPDVSRALADGILDVREGVADLRILGQEAGELFSDLEERALPGGHQVTVINSCGDWLSLLNLDEGWARAHLDTDVARNEPPAVPLYGIGTITRPRTLMLDALGLQR